MELETLCCSGADGGTGGIGDANGRWTSLDSLCEVAAAVSVAGATGADIPTQFEEEEAFSSVHDMIHAAVASHGNRATLRQIYLACQARGRIAYRRSGGSRLITHNEHWKSQIRHALYTSSRFERTGADGELWEVTEPFAGKGFQVTKVLVPANTDLPKDGCPQTTIPEDPPSRHTRGCRRIRAGSGSMTLSKPCPPRIKRATKPRVARHKMPAGQLHKPVSDQMLPFPYEEDIQNRCPVLGVKVPRKMRSGVIRLTGSGLSSSTLAVCSNSDDESACKANEENNIHQVKPAEIPATRALMETSAHTPAIMNSHCGRVPRPVLDDIGEARSTKQTPMTRIVETAPPRTKNDSIGVRTSLECPTAMATDHVQQFLPQGTSAPFAVRLPGSVAPVMLMESYPRALGSTSMVNLSHDVIELMSMLRKAAENSARYGHKGPE